MLILCNFRPDFAHRIHGRIYLAADNILRLLKGIQTSPNVTPLPFLFTILIDTRLPPLLYPNDRE